MIEASGNSETSVDIEGPYNATDVKPYVAASILFEYFLNISTSQRRKRSSEKSPFDEIEEYFINYIIGNGFCPAENRGCQNDQLIPDYEYWY